MVRAFSINLSVMLRLFPLRTCKLLNRVRYLETASLALSGDVTSSVIVKPIPPRVTWASVKNMMKEFGYVKSCVLNKEDGVSTAIVTFGHGTDLQAVVERMRCAPSLQQYSFQVDPYKLPEILDSDVKDIGTSRLLVKGLPVNCRWQDLKDHMRLSGGTVHLVIMNSDKDMNFVGTAVVIYDTIFEASKAYAVLRNSPFHGKVLQLRPDFLPVVKEPEEPVNPFLSSPDDVPVTEPANPLESARTVQGQKGRKLFVYNLQFEVGWKELKDHFRLVGDVEKADVLVDANGISKGSGFVVFRSEKDAAKAVETLHLSRIRNRPIYVRYDIPAGQEVRSSTKLMIDGVPLDASKEELENLILASTAGYQGCEMQQNARLKKQTAVAVFDTAENAKNALHILNDSLMMNKVLRVKYFRNWNAL